MLNIPDSVKALFKRDGVYKNFRAHFPNGELPDITNSDIVQESVHFTESVCSQDVFKFGLTEASTIEFETVGVANMYGMTIECSCEIDCSSLSAADKATIAAGTWDGTWDGVNAVFSVPYGTFRVESCPRDHQAMTHRKVTAYTQTPQGINTFERRKLACWHINKTYSPFLQSFALAQIATTSPKTLLDLGYTASNVTLSRPTGIWDMWSKEFDGKDTNGDTVHIRFSLDGRYTYNVGTRPTKYNLWLVSGYQEAAYDYTTIIAAAAAILEANNVDAVASGYDSLEELAKKYLPTTFAPHVEYANSAAPIKPNEVFYPYAGGMFTKVTQTYNISVYTSGTVWVGSNYAALPIPSSVPTVIRYTPPSTTELFTISFEPTANERQTVGQFGKMPVYSYADAVDAEAIANGWLELSCKFATASRLGGNKIIGIDNTSPVAVIPGEYSQMWFDEYTVESIGTIRYAYTDEAGEEQIVDYQFGTGASVYDMTDNAVLKAMAVADPSVIEAILDAQFIPHISAVNFVPIDLQMKGLPYIEAGDALSVTAQDATVCNSYALRQEIDGVQALEAQIDSQSGLIIESEAGA